MITEAEIKKWQSALHSKIPLLGRKFRRDAMAALEARKEEPQVVSVLIEATRNDDGECATRAHQALETLGTPPAINALCGQWVKGRSPELGEIIARRKYVATEPVSLRVLTALKVGDQAAVTSGDAGVISVLLGLLQDSDAAIKVAAAQALGNLKGVTAISALCSLGIMEPGGVAARICVERGYRPSDHEQACLFLFVTRQLDAYFKEDFEFQNLRLQYDRADEKMRALVMDVVRGGDRRCLPFITRPRKALHDCNEVEIKLALKSCLQHQDWNRLFMACLELPAKYSFPAWDRFRASGWQPENAELASLYKQILVDSSGQSVEPPSPPKAASGVFERWLAEGRKPELANASEGDLVSRLKTAIPPEGVPLVAALAAKPRCSETTIKAVAENEHWLIRLAGLATGLTRDIVTEGHKDTNYWVNELAGAAGVLEFWPGKGTPTDLEKLKNAPAEAYVGKLGAVRKVLRTILGYRVTIGTFEDIQVQAGETDAEFILAD